MMRHIKIILLAGIAVALSVVMNGQQLFPELKGYRAVDEYPVYTPDDLWDYINGAADGYLALGFADLTIREYVRGKNKIKAEIYRFGNDSQAFGMYSMERSPGYDFIRAGVQGYSEQGLVHFYKDRYYVKLMTHSGSAKVNAKMRDLALLISGRIEGSNDFPALLKLFPAEGRLQDQETYLLESVLGHGFLRKAFRASYELDGDRFDIYLFSRDGEEEAALMAGSLAGDAFDASEEFFKYAFEDGYNGVLHMARRGSTMVIVSGLGFDKTPVAERYIASMLGE
ncbi:MAG: hypothetical protein P1P83_03745 [Bacteroidales bacterium]|nr:hypothetical protein [Bacteroidales bacterium]MDT8372836.1 DUF6599 family protein [Bacteroidales bacterium]